MARKTSKTSSIKLNVKPKKHMLVVLGMHRSGTSAFAGMLHHLGATLPRELMLATKDNEKGYFESIASLRFHDDLFRQAGSTWRDWRPFNKSWLNSANGETLKDQASELLLDQFGNAPLCVFKDPRICRLFAFWAEAAENAGITTLPVLTHRNPLEVAQSLFQRDGVDPSEAYLIWLRHILDAEIQTRGTTRFFTSYDRLLRNWAGEVKRIQSTLEIVFPRFDERAGAKIDEFLSTDLRHFQEPKEKVTDNPRLSAWLQDTFEIMDRWAENGEKKADYATLDGIRAAFDAAGPLFAPLIDHTSSRALSYSEEIDTLRKERDSARVDLDAKTATLEERNTERETLKRDIADRDAKAASDRAAHEKREADARSQIDTLRKERDSARADRNSKVKALDTRVATLEAELEAEQSAHLDLQVAFDNLRNEGKRLTTEAAQATQEAEVKAETFSKALEEAREEANASQTALDALQNNLASLEASNRELEAALKEAFVTNQDEKQGLEVALQKSQAEIEVLRQTEAETKEAYNSKSDKLDEARSQLTTITGHLSHLESALQQRRHEADEASSRADALLEERDAALGELEALRAEAFKVSENHTKLERELQNQRIRVETRNAELASLTNLFLQSEQTVAQQKDDITAMTTHTDNLLAQLDNTQEELSDLRAEGRLNADKQQKLEHQIEHRVKQITALESQIEQHMQDVITLQSKAQAQNRELGELSRLLFEAETSLEEKTNSYAKLEGLYVERGAKLQQDEEHLAVVTSQISQQQAHIVAIEGERASISSRVMALQEEVQALRESTSWRITRPLRRIRESIPGSGRIVR